MTIRDAQSQSLQQAIRVTSLAIFRLPASPKRSKTERRPAGTAIRSEWL